MYIIAGRGGVISTLLGLFILFIAFGLKVMFYAFVAAVGIVYYMLMGIRWLYRRHKAKKAGTQQVITLQNAPLPVKAKIGPRDWSPR
jgi:hypothetical protein